MEPRNSRNRAGRPRMGFWRDVTDTRDLQIPHTQRWRKRPRLRFAAWDPLVVQTSLCFPTGRSRMRVPVAAKIALQNAAMNGGTPGSPTPAGGAVLSTKYTFVCRGTSLMRATG